MENIEKRIENFKLLKNEIEKINKASYILTESFKNKNKVLFCGNGGSASDCNHLACEFISKFKKERKSLPAISLCSNNSIITAVSNDYSFENIFSRQMEGLANENDILIAISTSAKSKNVLNAIKYAKENNLKVIFLTGKNKTNLNIDVEINATSDITCEIQELHIAIEHIICEIIEE